MSPFAIHTSDEVFLRFLFHELTSSFGRMSRPFRGTKRMRGAQPAWPPSGSSPGRTLARSARSGSGAGGASAYNTVFPQAPVKAIIGKKTPLFKSLKPEVKYIDYNVSVNTSTALGLALTQLTAIGQGTAASDRIGLKIRVTGIEFMYSWTTIGAAGAHRVFLIKVKQSGATPTASNLMSGGTAYGLEATTSQFKKYKLFWDNSAYASGASTFTDASLVHQPQTLMRMDVPVTYTGGSSGDTETNLLYFGAMAETASTSTCRASIRVYYTDV